MRNQNIIHITKEELERPLYRILPFSRLIEMFETEKLTLLSPSIWDDPFENFILKSTFLINKKKIQFQTRNQCFGQCWTLKSVSDAMWRIYSPDKASVRIKTRVKKLGTSLSSAVAVPDVSAFMGRVKYLGSKKLNNQAGKLAENILATSGKYLAKSLLFKRSAFSHEREVRLLYFDHEDMVKGNVFSFKINPHDLIETVLVDPRATEQTVDLYKYYLKNQLNFKGRVKRSVLYDPPKELTIELTK